MGAYNLYSDIFTELDKDDINTHEKLLKYGLQLDVLPYLSCWPQFVPIPLPLFSEDDHETIYGLKGVRIMCPFDERGTSKYGKTSHYPYRYFIVESNNKKGGFANWGALEGSKILEIGSISSSSQERHGIVYSVKENGEHGMFVFTKGKVRRRSPFVIKLKEQVYMGRFGDIELESTGSDGTIKKWTPESDKDFAAIDNLIPTQYRRRSSDED